jgi:hypothetical protein
LFVDPLPGQALRRVAMPTAVEFEDGGTLFERVLPIGFGPNASMIGKKKIFKKGGDGEY